MGLTIHYAFRSDARTSDDVRRQIEALRQKSLDLPFKEVGEVLDLSGSECDFNRRRRDDPVRWLLIQAGQSVMQDGLGSLVAPNRLIAFSAWPGEGCEEANFGLARYPGHLCDEDRQVRSGLPGWSWQSFCKTQFASNPASSGVLNFLRCHLSVISLLDHAEELGILESVSDEGGFWEERNPEALTDEVGKWNETIAAEFGRLKDRLGDGVTSPLGEYPNFEHLEARGRSKHTKRPPN